MILVSDWIFTEYVAACAEWPVWGLFNGYFLDVLKIFFCSARGIHTDSDFASTMSDLTWDSERIVRSRPRLINAGPCVKTAVWTVFLPHVLLINEAKRTKISGEAQTSTGFFIEDIERGGVVAIGGVARPLPPRLVARLVGVPQLPTVIAELCVAALAAAAQLGTLGAAVSDHCIAGEKQKGRMTARH